MVQPNGLWLLGGEGDIQRHWLPLQFLEAASEAVEATALLDARHEYHGLAHDDGVLENGMEAGWNAIFFAKC